MQTEIKATLMAALTVACTSITGAFFNRSGMEWYKTLTLPPITPPSWIFSPVWTTLYILIILTAYIPYKELQNSSDVKIITLLFCMNGFFNSIWTYLFFYNQFIGWALVDALALALTTWLLWIYIKKHSRIGATLLIPYALWTTFAAYLNYLIYTLNVY